MQRNLPSLDYVNILQLRHNANLLSPTPCTSGGVGTCQYCKLDPTEQITKAAESFLKKPDKHCAVNFPLAVSILHNTLQQPGLPLGSMLEFAHCMCVCLQAALHLNELNQNRAFDPLIHPVLANMRRTLVALKTDINFVAPQPPTSSFLSPLVSLFTSAHWLTQLRNHLAPIAIINDQSELPKANELLKTYDTILQSLPRQKSDFPDIYDHLVKCIVLPEKLQRLQPPSTMKSYGSTDTSYAHLK